MHVYMTSVLSTGDAHTHNHTHIYIYIYIYIYIVDIYRTQQQLDGARLLLRCCPH